MPKKPDRRPAAAKTKKSTSRRPATRPRKKTSRPTRPATKRGTASPAAGPGKGPDDLRSRGEEALRESEERYRTLVERLPDGVYRSTPEGRFLEVNPAMVRILGYDSRQELLALDDIASLFFDDPEDRGRVNTLQQRGDGRAEFRVRRKDESMIWVEDRCHFVRSDEGNVVLHEGTCRDITQLKHAEEALRQSEERYRGLFEESIAAVYLFDEKKRFLDSNLAGLDLLGYSRQELLSMSISDVDADPKAVLPAQEQVLSGDRIVNYEHSVRRKDGHVVTVLNNSRPLSNDEGQVVGMQSTLIDITDRKRNEEALRESEEKYRLLADNVTDVIWTRGLDLAISYVSPSVERLRGFTPEEVLAQSLDETMTPTSARLVRETLSEELAWLQTATPEKVAARALVLEVEMTCKDGSTVWTELKAQLLTDPEGRPDKIVGISRDITERKRAEEALRESVLQLRQVLSHAPVILSAVDLEGKYILSEGKGLAALGRKPGESLGVNAF
jgi:PAS domain S-box-containing protein